jgi:uncharacterized membrane protein (UPF0127 family)
VATTRRSRLLGLARLEKGDAGPGLLIENCRSVHTFGVRFPLDLVFLDERGRPLALHRAVAPRRILSFRRATHVVEFPSRTPHKTKRRAE